MLRHLGIGIGHFRAASVLPGYENLVTCETIHAQMNVACRFSSIKSEKLIFFI